MAVADDEDLVVVVLAVALVGLGEFLLDQLLEADRGDAPLVVAVAARPVVLGVVELFERDVLLLEVRGQPVDECALLLLLVVGAIPVVPIGLVGSRPRIP
jgi:hypothetical protein